MVDEESGSQIYEESKSESKETLETLTDEGVIKKIKGITGAFNEDRDAVELRTIGDSGPIGGVVTNKAL